MFDTFVMSGVSSLIKFLSERLSGVFVVEVLYFSHFVHIF